MDAEKLAMQRRIDNLQQHIDYLYGELRDYERQTAKLTVELETVKRERDALIYDLKEASPCFSCKAFLRNGGKCRGGHGCLDDLMIKILGDKVGSGWEWRGLCAENGGVE